MSETLQLSQISPKLEHLRLNRSFVDLNIIGIDGTRVCAHKVVLAAQWSNIEHILNNTHNGELSWAKYPSSIIEAAVHFAYTGEIQLDVSNTMRVYLLALNVGSAALEQLCIDFFLPRITRENIEHTWSIALGTGSALLKSGCITVMRTHFEGFFESSLFLKLDLETIKVILNTFDFPGKPEETKLQAIITWVIKSNDRTEHLRELSTLIFQNKSTESTAQDTFLFGQFKGIAIAPTKQIHCLTPSVRHFDSPHATPFSPSFKLDVSDAASTSQSQPSNVLAARRPSVFQRRMEASNVLAVRRPMVRHRLPAMPPRRVAPANNPFRSTNSTAHAIFLVVRIKNDDSHLRIVQLDPMRNEVTSVGEIPYLWAPSVVVCGNSIFCLENYHGSKIIYQFNLVTRTLGESTRLMKPFCQSASAASDHEVIVSGGGNTMAFATCSVYAPATNGWMSLRQLHQARTSHKMCWLPCGQVFAIGGWYPCGRQLNNMQYLSSVEMLEREWIPAPRKKVLAEWQNVAPMKMERYGFGCCVVEGRIVVAGGMTVGGKPSSSVESFEPPTPTNIGQWTSMTNLASAVGLCFLVHSAAGLLLIPWDYKSDDDGKIQCEKYKAQVFSSSGWTWKPSPTLISFDKCFGLVSWHLTHRASQR